MLQQPGKPDGDQHIRLDAGPYWDAYFIYLYWKYKKTNIFNPAFFCHSASSSSQHQPTWTSFHRQINWILKCTFSIKYFNICNCIQLWQLLNSLLSCFLSPPVNWKGGWRQRSKRRRKQRKLPHKKQQETVLQLPKKKLKMRKKLIQRWENLLPMFTFFSCFLFSLFVFFSLVKHLHCVISDIVSVQDRYFKFFSWCIDSSCAVYSDMSHPSREYSSLLGAVSLIQMWRIQI